MFNVLGTINDLGFPYTVVNRKLKISKTKA